MRVAVVSDIHGNRTAFEAVLSDLKLTAPDLILHGGDLADAGSSPAEIVDRIRDLGWQGVSGNTDEMLTRPESLREFAAQSPGPAELFAVIGEMAAATREALGEERLAWLRGLPLQQTLDSMTLVHASPAGPWRAPAHTAEDAELQRIYSPLGQPVAVYAHIHRSFIRSLPDLTVANTGSVSLSYDGDTRAAYLLLDGSDIEIRRVEYDVAGELEALNTCGLPHSDWVAGMLRSGCFRMP